MTRRRTQMATPPPPPFYERDWFILLTIVGVIAGAVMACVHGYPMS